MKDNKNTYLNLLLFIGFPVSIVSGILTVLVPESNRLTALGYALILLGAYFLIMWLIRMLALHSVKKEKAQKERKELLEKQVREKFFNAALQAVEDKTDYPEPNTVKIVNDDIEFFAEGKYVCEKDFKNIPGYHFAFTVSSTGLKHMPDDYDDVCDLAGNGVFIEAGYFERQALEEVANDNGIVLQDSAENSIGQTITLKENSGYNLYVWTADGDEVDYGFVKILKYENDVLTVYFKLNVPAGLCDTVEGTAELKKDTFSRARDIDSLINIIKHRPYNTISMSDKEVREIEQTNPFLPESYITFLRKVGNADLDWIDVGWNKKTPNNLNDDEIGYIKDISADYKDTDSDDYYFIGIDNSDSYYAFSKKADDKKVYVFSNDAPNINSYDSFEDFIFEILFV